MLYRVQINRYNALSKHGCILVLRTQARHIYNALYRYGKCTSGAVFAATMLALALVVPIVVYGYTYIGSVKNREGNVSLCLQALSSFMSSRDRTGNQNTTTESTSVISRMRGIKAGSAQFSVKVYGNASADHTVPTADQPYFEGKLSYIPVISTAVGSGSLTGRVSTQCYAQQYYVVKPEDAAVVERVYPALRITGGVTQPLATSMYTPNDLEIAVEITTPGSGRTRKFKIFDASESETWQHGFEVGSPQHSTQKVRRHHVKRFREYGGTSDVQYIPIRPVCLNDSALGDGYAHHTEWEWDSNIAPLLEETSSTTTIPTQFGSVTTQDDNATMFAVPVGGTVNLLINDYTPLMLDADNIVLIQTRADGEVHVGYDSLTRSIYIRFETVSAVGSMVMEDHILMLDDPNLRMKRECSSAHASYHVMANVVGNIPPGLPLN